jgi:hypothetical protein
MRTTQSHTTTTEPRTGVDTPANVHEIVRAFLSRCAALPCVRPDRRRWRTKVLPPHEHPVARATRSTLHEPPAPSLPRGGLNAPRTHDTRPTHARGTGVPPVRYTIDVASCVQRTPRASTPRPITLPEAQPQHGAPRPLAPARRQVSRGGPAHLTRHATHPAPTRVFKRRAAPTVRHHLANPHASLCLSGGCRGAAAPGMGGVGTMVQHDIQSRNSLLSGEDESLQPRLHRPRWA